MKNGTASSFKKKETPALSGSGHANGFASSAHTVISKSVGKPTSIVLTQNPKEPKKRLMCDSSIKKPTNKKTKLSKGITNSTSNDIAGNHSNVPSIKQNYKTAPSMKNPNLIPEENKMSLSKENFYSTKVNETKNIMLISDNVTQKGTLLDKKAQSTATKNANVNLWRKPLVIGPQTNSAPAGSGKNYIKISKKGNCNVTTAAAKQNSTCTNVLSTNSTENTKDKEMIFDYKNTSPSSIRFLDTPKDDEYSKFKKNVFPANNINTPSFDILASIQNFQTLLKSNEQHAFQMERLMQSDENKNKISQLNKKLGTLNRENGSLSLSLSLFPTWKEKYNKVNVINANMLDGFCQNVNNNPQIFSDQLKSIREEEENATSFKNDNTIGKASDVCLNSDMRIKRYEILLDFLNTNLKEMGQMIASSDNNNVNRNLNLNFNNNIRNEDVGKLDDQNKLSSLHSKIDLTKTNLNNENIYDIEDSEMQEKSNIIVPVGNLDIKENSTTTLNVLRDITKHNPNHNHNNNLEMSPSLLISTINSDLYKFLMDETYNLNGLSHLSNDMCSICTQNENIKKLERMISLDNTDYKNIIDRNPNPNRYIRAHRSKMKDDEVITINNRDRDTGRRSIAEGELNYREGEENVEGSDVDKTKEDIELFDTKRNGSTMEIKDIEKIKTPKKSEYFSSKENMVIKPSARTEEKPKNSAKCIVF